VTRPPVDRPRRRVGIDVLGVVVALACYVLLATRGEALGWVVP